MDNRLLIEKTVEITIAKISANTTITGRDSGKKVADFMQEIYDKLVELDKKASQ